MERVLPLPVAPAPDQDANGFSPTTVEALSCFSTRLRHIPFHCGVSCLPAENNIPVDSATAWRCVQIVLLKAKYNMLQQCNPYVVWGIPCFASSVCLLCCVAISPLMYVCCVAVVAASTRSPISPLPLLYKHPSAVNVRVCIPTDNLAYVLLCDVFAAM